ncbi:MAG: NAD-dependent epimerase/dehydratase family protein [Proteobacteria bacterium]|nr:NAD-dependent epimerase/dehydratase family protein [Pseudomonadota bacterium]
MKKALVTGAAGFIGSHVVKELLDDNVDVRAFLRPGESRQNLDGLDVEIMEGDLLDKDAVGKAVNGMDTLFHLAAVYAIWMKNWQSIYEVNIQGSRNILWAALKAGVNRVVYTSSIAALGVAPGKQPGDEDTPFNQYDLGNHYVLTKYLSQQEALGFAANGLDLVVVNPAFPFGANDIAPTPTGQIIIDICNGINRYSFNGGFNVVDVRDVAKGHILAAKKGKTGEKYILGNMNLTMPDFMHLVNGAVGRENRFTVKIPARLLQAGTYFLKGWSDHVSHKPPMSTPPEIKYASQYLYVDNAKARNELGLELTPIDESIDRAIEWFRKNRYIRI